ncbi:cell wall synthase accessory phosphoprotein MacP [Streptococcus equi subsp. zooepidemicus]|uniref:cell wall synthase accessory phosphoprotein MacP n=1 Tax=Streptococcus equi TaxID=1336 RepID=UPI0024A7D78B|nr:cell wall synthase accessory phosphoprotein MacP [Streptococcus equi]MDI5918933.1 cell wall synthase accessory phosphoprotein MacP [Streptococcus equi subsp. zooepidemicus]MDI5957030.1 cell wall synthase accessory phosphoprotein MacP [Streptococcus equi subsp. zooepidemicus]
MGKPLLTDDIIERTQRGEQFEPDDYADFETKIMTFEDNHTDRIYKSRRIENAKRSRFQSRLNLILLAVLVLIALLVYAVFNL